jgi:hypothetical protein
MKGYNYYTESFKRDVVREILDGCISKAGAKENIESVVTMH